MSLIKEIRTKAKKIKGKIVLPEANIDSRVYNACKYILENGLSDIIVFGQEKEYDK